MFDSPSRDFDSSSEVVVDRRALLTMQIIVGALVCGCVFFLAVVLFALPRRGPILAPPHLTVSLVAVGFTLVALVARLVVAAVVTALGRRRIASRDGVDLQDASVGRGLVALYQTRMIVGAALLESATFFLLVAYLIEGTPLVLMLAVVLILGIGLHMPTRAGVTRWIEGQMRRMHEGREFDAQGPRDFRGT